MGAVLDVVYVVPMGGSACLRSGVGVFLFSLNDDASPPFAWSLLVVIIDVKYPVSAS